MVDEQAALGVATTRAEERILASLGKLQAAPIRFEPATDVPRGGVLCALPALLALGLLRHSAAYFTWLPGYYPLETIFLAIAVLALARVPSLEALRYEPPGEWGRLLGRDRIPEVRTLRDKLRGLCQAGEKVRAWSSTLAQEWMAAAPESAGTLYVDGHVRVYHGKLTPLPRRYVARQRLCLRGTTDYWVNAMDGQPFFVVTQAADPGLLQTLETEIIPRLLAEVPGQPTEAELTADRWPQSGSKRLKRMLLLEASVPSCGQPPRSARHHRLRLRPREGSGGLATKRLKKAQENAWHFAPCAPEEGLEARGQKASRTHQTYM